jgi:hypothetical protein
VSEAQTVISVILGIVSLVGVLFGLLRHLIKHYLSELRPDNNGGHNLRGRVEHIEQRVDRIYELLLDKI